MLKKIFCKTVAIIFALTLIFSTASAEGIWRLDSDKNKELPRNLRILDDLKISESGQPSTDGLLKLYEELRKHIDGNIYILDLREESHGFANRIPVSYYEGYNLANFFTPKEEIEKIERKQLRRMLNKNFDFLPLGNEDKNLFKPINVTVKNVATERVKAEEFGFKYMRFPTTDMFFPTPEVVEEFINFVYSLDENDWVHFHCQAGHGRTTTFAMMYEIIKCPEKSLGEISRHQIEMGGSDLITRKVDNGDHDYEVEAYNLRAQNLIDFFFYIRTSQNKEIDMTWSEYLHHGPRG